MREREFMYVSELRRYFGVPMQNGSIMPVSRDTIESMFKNGLKKSFIGGRVIVWVADLETYLNMVRENGSSKRSAQ